MLPSASMIYPHFDFLAKLSANKLWLLLKTMVSGLFMYLGSPSPRMRPEKPMTLPRTSMTGNMSRLRNVSYTPPERPWRTSPPSKSSCSE